MNPKRTFPALILAALTAAACESGREEPAGPTIDPASLNACELFTVRDALQFAGRPVAPMSSTFDDASNTGNPLVCSFNAGTPEQPRPFSLEIRPADTPAAAARRLEGGRDYLKHLSGGEVQEVPGVGDKAIFAGGDLHQLHVLRGNLVLVITAKTENPPKSLYLAKLIAQRVLDRLAGGEGAQGAPVTAQPPS